MIQISFDEHSLPTQAVLRATAVFLSTLAGDLTLRTKAEVQATAGDTGHITDADIGTDADRPNVDAPSTAGAETLPTAEAIFGQNPSVPVPPVPGPEAAANVPTVPAAPTSPADVDSGGLRWDERIHSSSRAKVADGTWRQKRGVDAALVTAVEAELRGASPAVPAPPLGTIVEAPANMTFAGDTTPKTFPAFVQWVMGYVKAQKITQSEVNEAVKELGLPGLPALTMRPDLIPAAVAKINDILSVLKDA
jgi:hypothetical protein